MLDHGALGTLLIGLESIRLESERSVPEPPRRGVAANRLRAVRAWIAGGLRAIADRLQPLPALR
jgi:hypothetical protein